VAEPPTRRLVTKEEWLGAIGVFLLVFVSTHPVVLPFVFMSEARPALRLSIAIATVMLYFCGHSLGR
jgi:VIT1/CCC1 family predicted Fe2+/Mn2+ transporter